MSDSCYAKVNQDKSGPALAHAISCTDFTYRILARELVPDDKLQIQNVLISLCLKKCQVVLTTGGTGFSKRDVTPEATRAVIEREAPGIIYTMIARSLNVTEMAMLSRAVCGIRESTLIINLPGSSHGAVQCFGFVKSVIPHAVDLICGKESDVRKVHGDHGGAQNSSSICTCSSTGSHVTGNTI